MCEAPSVLLSSVVFGLDHGWASNMAVTRSRRVEMAETWTIGCALTSCMSLSWKNNATTARSPGNSPFFFLQFCGLMLLEIYETV